MEIDKDTPEILSDSCPALFLTAIHFQNQRPHPHPFQFIVCEYKLIKNLPEQFNMIELTPRRGGKL